MSNTEASTATETAEVEVSIRQQCKDSTQEEFAQARTKQVLKDIATELSVGPDIIAKGTKAELVAAIYSKFPLPNPALRGKSVAADPVAEVWALAHRSFEEAAPEKPRRKDVVAAGQELGIAYYTVRTQYQSWFKYTLGGTNMITADSEGLPKGLKEMLFPEEAAA